MLNTIIVAIPVAFTFLFVSSFVLGLISLWNNPSSHHSSHRTRIGQTLVAERDTVGQGGTVYELFALDNRIKINPDDTFTVEFWTEVAPMTKRLYDPIHIAVVRALTDEMFPVR